MNEVRDVKACKSALFAVRDRRRQFREKKHVRRDLVRRQLSGGGGEGVVLREDEIAEEGGGKGRN